ncbi:MAG: PstS family phosphate ABC transporter substrate-binding protein, partial [Candidatus Nanopelagicales bacterium]|nr:PstS family phosphate ABC transporter substrate-binding protein [Candidatus Nanopelagicales bacterium]
MTRTKAVVVGALAAAGTLVLAACGGGQGSGSGTGVRVDGSSTVAPLTSAAAEKFRASGSSVNVTVGTSGSGGGFEKFCRGETDMNDASRPIKDSEIQACKSAGIEYKVLTVANDALSVVVNKENTWAKCLTTAQLKKIWEPKSQIKNWNQVSPSFPDVPLTLFGPGTDSGTFDYFTDEINGKEGASRTDYTPSEDDNVIVQGVTGTKGGLGYFGFTYYEENQSKLNVVEIDSGAGCVKPSAAAVQDSTYTPLGRPLFVYPSAKSLASNQGFLQFLDYYVKNDTSIAEAALYIPLSDKQRAQLEAD